MRSALSLVITTLAALTMTTKSPVSTCGANCGLCLPRSRMATWLARRPRTTSDASMTCHARVTSPGFGVYVRTKMPSLLLGAGRHTSCASHRGYLWAADQVKRAPGGRRHRLRPSAGRRRTRGRPARRRRRPARPAGRPGGRPRSSRRPATASAGRSTTAQSTGFQRAIAAIQPGSDSVGTSIEDRNDSGSTTKFTAPITDSWLRSSSASAFEYDANAAAEQDHAARGRPA